MDSNHRMAASKAAALPLGYTPELSSSFNKGDLLIVLVITYANFLGALSIISFPSSKELIFVNILLPVPEILTSLFLLKKSNASLTRG